MNEPIVIFKFPCEGNKYKFAGEPTLKEKREYSELIAAGCTVITIPIEQFRSEKWEWCPKHSVFVK